MRQTFRQQHGADHEEGQDGQYLPLGLDELEDESAPPAQDFAEGETRNERCQESIAVAALSCEVGNLTLGLTGDYSVWLIGR